ncbi:hypothetical protein DOK78_002991 [Enterococcus sp. DIV2402]|uniref:Glycosyl transferase family 1 domain-containing protein n=1 Tax=Candidatus Enterococcus lowellii TaxID=2230877 RepID=A0ABZ2SWK7_9ENTE|nr:glycosyltransferase [Enterococcus sp. DIV2402]MBO0465346.1 glycosyltransferase [Enterococcus sp. DIV2402]
MKIIFVCDHGHFGGATQMLVWVASQMKKKGHDIRVLTFCSSQDFRSYDDSLVFDDFNFKERTQNEKRSMVDFIKLNRDYFNYMKQHRPDVVVNFGDHSFYLSFFYKKLLNYYFVISERVDPFYPISKLAVIRRKLYNFADGAVFQTAKAQSYFSNRIIKKSRVIFNPVKLKSNNYWKHSKHDKSFIYVGRIDINQKRLDLLIDAFNDFCKDNNRYILKIYGTGSEKNTQRLQQMVAMYNLEKKVVFKGYIDDVASVLLENEIFVLTSDFEGIPNSLIEAMAVGMPVISSDCSPGGARVLVQDKENGLLFERGNKEQLVSLMNEIVDNHKMQIRMGENARQSLSKFTEDTISSQWEDFFLNIRS